VDYQSSFICFLHDGVFVTVYGENAQRPTQAHFNHIRRLVHVDVIAETFAIQVQPNEEATHETLSLPESMDLALALLLQNYGSVFKQPSGLPPQRDHDHYIPLVLGAAPVKARPYRYSHS